MLTTLRMTADTLLIPTWPALGAVAVGRDVLDRGIRYHLMLPALDLRLDFNILGAPTVMTRLALLVRPRGLVRRMSATLTRPLDAGFECIASVVLSDGSISSLGPVLLELRTALWDDPKFGPDSIGLQRVV
jgi:hypothetical protein